MPISAVVGKAHIMDSAISGTIGGTYIGSPLSCVAALATIQYMEDIDLNKRADEVGAIIRNRFNKMKIEYSEIGDVRGLGAMMGIELVKNGDPHQPSADLCSAIIKNCLERGLILLNAGTYKNVIRILCPLVITDEQLNIGLDIIQEEFSKLIIKIKS
jgi:4-aminobutyrate aminotransferase/(S)-3-amino-2-methylpropionate transaminase